MQRTIACKECGSPATAVRSKAEFCSTACRTAFNTRRRERGVELYDVLMSAKYEENGGAPRELVDNMLSAYKLSDNAKRDGRRSWQRWREAQTRIPMAYGKAGDNR